MKVKLFFKSLRNAFIRFRVEAVGADYDELLKSGTGEELNKFIFNGSIVMLTSFFAFLGAFFFFSELFINYKVPWLKMILILIFSTCWGLIVFNLDRAFMAGMLGKHGKKRVFVALPRLILAIGIGFVISHPLKMLFFDDILEFERLKKINTLVEEEEISLTKRKERYAGSLEEEKIEIRKFEHLKSEKIKKFEKEISLANMHKNKIEKWRFQFICFDDDISKKNDASKGDTCSLFRSSTLKSEIFKSPEGGTINIKFPKSKGAGDPPENFNNLNSLNIDQLIELHELPEKIGGKKNRKRLQSNHFANILIDRWEDKIKELINLRDNIKLKNIISETKNIDLTDLNREISAYQNSISDINNEIGNLKLKFMDAYPNNYIEKTTILGEITQKYTSCLNISNNNCVKKNDSRAESEFKKGRSMFWIGFFVMLIFMFIEISPILVKLMSTMGSYERNIFIKQNEMDEKDQEERIKKTAQEKEIEEIINATELLEIERKMAEKIALGDITLSLMEKEINDIKKFEDLKNILDRYKSIDTTQGEFI